MTESGIYSRPRYSLELRLNRKTDLRFQSTLAAVIHHHSTLMLTDNTLHNRQA